MADTTAKQVADYLIAFSHEVGDPITNMKLQKLLYYAQGWYLGLSGRPLFSERIEAWPHGPVVPPIYGEFKKWKWNPIADDPGFPTLSVSLTAHLKEVMDVYGALTAYHLEQLTHKDAPWIEARAGLPPDAPSSAVISVDSMRKHFGMQAADGNKTT